MLVSKDSCDRDTQSLEDVRTTQAFFAASSAASAVMQHGELIG
jgi:hypothetical protein